MAPVPASANPHVRMNSAASSSRLRRAIFLAEPIYFSPNLIPHPARSFQTFFTAAGESRRILERPMQSGCRPGEHRTTFGFSLAANGYDEMEHVPRLRDIE